RPDDSTVAATTSRSSDRVNSSTPRDAAASSRECQYQRGGQSTCDCETILPPARSGAFGHTPTHDEGDIMSVATISRGRITSATSRYVLLALLAAVMAPL